MKIRGLFGDHYDAVYVDGERLDPRPSQQVFNHSPDGFAWGYGGSGPAQLALAILMHAGVEDEEATRLHQRFKRDFIEALPQENFEVDADVLGWVSMQDVPV